MPKPLEKVPPPLPPPPPDLELPPPLEPLLDRPTLLRRRLEPLPPAFTIASPGTPYAFTVNM